MSLVVIFVLLVIDSNITQKKELIDLAYTNSLIGVSDLNDESLIFFLKHGKDLKCFYDILNYFIIPEGSQNVLKHVSKLEHPIELKIVIQTIMTTTDVWRREHLINILSVLYPELNDSLKSGKEPVLNSDANNYNQLIKIINQINRIKYLQKALGPMINQIPDYIESWNISTGLFSTTLKGDVVYLWDKYDNEVYTRQTFPYTIVYDYIINLFMNELCERWYPKCETFEVLHTGGGKFVFEKNDFLMY